MILKSLKSKLLMAVSSLVIGSGLLISLLVTHLYSSSLLVTMRTQAENLAHTVALDAADKILTNDLVALQKILDHQVHTNPGVAYLFISRDNRALTHTFPKNVPVDLLEANDILSEHQSSFQKIVSTDGESYLDIAWPVFEGKAGVLRLGFSEKPFRRQMTKLWLQMSAVTLGILLLSMGGSLLFIRRITKPVVALSRATQRIDKGEVGVRVQAQGEDEFGTLGTSFNRMVTRMETYTRQLEEQTMELERAHQQTRTFCGIVQEIGSLGRLNEIGAFLIKRFQGILKCDQMVLLVYNGNRDLLFALSAMGANALRGSEIIQTSWASLEGLKKITFSSQCIFQPPLVPDDFQSAARQAIIPFLHENEPIGALVVACPKECRCKIKELEIIGLTLTQAAGGIKRAIFQEEEIRDLQSRLETSTEFSGIVGKDPKMQLIYKLIEDIAPTDATVLIQGESGTGKELVARAIHRKSLRKNRPFVVLNCSAYPATLLESELFGHEKGAFTGAIRKKPGRFEQAHGGTIFLDEIGDIAASAQIRLLRVLQTKKFERLGGEQTQTVDVRILAATNKNLEKEVKGGQFREDLYYRLNVIPIHLPALRERRNDIPLLSRHFLRHFASEQGKDSLEFSPEAMRRLLGYSWPGNVRELENSAEHAAVLSKSDRIEITDLPAVLHTNFTAANTRKETFSTIIENEIELMQQVLDECGWNKKQAAQRLGISRSSLYEKLKKYKITRSPPHIRVIK